MVRRAAGIVPRPNVKYCTMLTLRSLPPSPFGRKVKIAASLLNIPLDIKAADTNDPGDDLRRQNPVGKIPVLIDEAGETYFDSRVIVEYLDEHAGGGKIVPRGKARLDALRLQALCDGALDACLLIVYEARFRDEAMRVTKWIDHQAGKVARAMDYLEANVPPLDPLPNVGQIALACLLGYRDLRFPDQDWRKSHPRLHAWHDKFAAQVPAFAATRATA